MMPAGDFNWNGSLIPLDPNKVMYIVIHHPEALHCTAQDIHQWHLQNGWVGIGYNEFIAKDGTVTIGRGDNIGAQTANFNSCTYGICCEGNYDIETQMPTAQFNALVDRINFHRPRFPNIQKVVPHSQLTQTACPGRFFPMEKLMMAINSTQDYSLSWAVNQLQSAGCIGSPEYWLQNAIIGRTCRGEYAAALIKNCAKKVSK